MCNLPSTCMSTCNLNKLFHCFMFVMLQINQRSTLNLLSKNRFLLQKPILWGKTIYESLLGCKRENKNSVFKDCNSSYETIWLSFRFKENNLNNIKNQTLKYSSQIPRKNTIIIFCHFVWVINIWWKYSLIILWR